MNLGNIGATSALKSFITKDVNSLKHSGAYWDKFLQFTRDGLILSKTKENYLVTVDRLGFLIQKILKLKER